jgi:hypothetical protein
MPGWAISPKCYRNERDGRHKIMIERPLLMSEKVLFVVAGPPALLGIIAALFI